MNPGTAAMHQSRLDDHGGSALMRQELGNHWQPDSSPGSWSAVELQPSGSKWRGPRGAVAVLAADEAFLLVARCANGHGGGKR